MGCGLSREWTVIPGGFEVPDRRGRGGSWARTHPCHLLARSVAGRARCCSSYPSSLSQLSLRADADAGRRRRRSTGKRRRQRLQQSQCHAGRRAKDMHTDDDPCDGACLRLVLWGLGRLNHGGERGWQGREGEDKVARNLQCPTPERNARCSFDKAKGKSCEGTSRRTYK